MPCSANIYLLLWVTAAALASFCVKAPGHTLPSSSSCSFLSPGSSWLLKEDPLSNVTLVSDNLERNLILFKRTTFTLQANLSISASINFTAASNDTEVPEGSLAFILARTPPHETIPISIQSFNFLPLMSDLNCFPACGFQISASGISNFAADDGEAFVKDELSFAYLADIAELSMQVVHHNIDGMECQQAFNFSINSDDCSFPSHSTLSTEESTITFFVGYITSGKPSINVTTSITHSTPSINVTGITHSTASSTLAKNTRSSTHIKVVPWVLVAIFSMGIFIGFLILVLLINKRRGRRPLNSSQPIGHGPPPRARRAPISHHDLESSAMPMMSAPCLPPVHSNAFQISGTASWLKQPNPR